MNIETPLGTPTKCGCAGGIVVSCSTAKVQRNKQKPRRTKKSAPSMPIAECSVCIQEKEKNDRCYMDNGDCNRDDMSGTYVTEEMFDERDDETEDNDILSDKRWYKSMFRGALGRWTAKRQTGSPKCKANHANHERPLSSPNAYQISNICTNNNCKTPDRCESNKDSSLSTTSITTPMPSKTTGTANKNKSESDLYVNKINSDVWYKQAACDNSNNPEGQGSSESGIHSSGIEDNCTSNKAPAGALRRLRSVRGRTGAERRLKSEGSDTRQKLPNLPYRETGNEDKKPVMTTTVNIKRQRGKRKYFSSPIHRKEPTRERTVQSTYVSFQDDIADDVYMNFDGQQGILSASASPDSMYARQSDPMAETPLQISPSSLNDDVFTPNGNAEPQNRLAMSREAEHKRDLYASKEELDDARIAKLFNQVNSAFDTNPQNEEKYINACENNRCMHSDIKCTKCMASQKKSHSEPIETIMASANLHASLDNALSMLSESTKLLSPNDNQGWHQAIYNMRHQSCGAAFSNMNFGSHHNTRSRTYSTCSRLETIEEENDRVDDMLQENTRKNTRDTTSCTFSDSSEHEKLYNISSSGATLLINSALAISQYSDSSLYRQRLHGGQVTDRMNDTSSKWIMNSCSGSMPRQNSTSTISVGSLQRGIRSTSGNVPAVTHTTDKCAACEWTRYQTVTVSSIPNNAWKLIAKETNQCHDRSHIHPWGVCSEQHSTPVLCHSHYLQYYQYLQNDSKSNRQRRRQLHSASSQADSLIDYDIHEVMNSLDEFAATSSDSSVTNYHRSSYQNEQIFLRDDTMLASSQSNIRSQYVDVRFHKKQDLHKQSNTDLSINSDSAFSTNGSLTPSTRDGANTDRESVDSINEHPGLHEDLINTDKLISHDKQETPEDVHTMSAYTSQNIWKRNADALDSAADNSIILKNAIQEYSRGTRTQSYDDTGFAKNITKDSISTHDKRYSVVSSLGSYHSPLTSDPLGDSAVHLPDSSSSHSTHLSSDSFYSSGTSHGDKETCLVDGALGEDVLSRSSSEASLKSEGTLCLSELGISHQNISLFSMPSFPQINDIVSPKRNKTTISLIPQNETKKSSSNLDSAEQFEEWIQKAEITESVLESFLNSSLAQIENPTIDASVSSTSSQFRRKKYPPLIHNNDTLTSSSGSSDTNTLGSGSSGSTYATSSLRSYKSSRFNTLDSSSCVSTDDTGETVIDQYMLRPSLCDIDEGQTQRPKMRRKKTNDINRTRYQPSTFHYQNLVIPSYHGNNDTFFKNERETHFDNNYDSNSIAIEEVTERTEVMISRTRASSMSCIMASVTKSSCIVRHSKSLPSLFISQSRENETVQTIKNGKSITTPLKTQKLDGKTFSPIYGHVLQTKVQSMMQNCANIDNVILSLRESLKSTTNLDTGDYVDKKLQELGDILKQKDEMISQLHKMLIKCSMKGYKNEAMYQINATL